MAFWEASRTFQRSAPVSRSTRVEVVVPRTDVHDVADDRRRGGHRVAGREEPRLAQRRHRGLGQGGPAVEGVLGVVAVGRPVPRPARRARPAGSVPVERRGRPDAAVAAARTRRRGTATPTHATATAEHTAAPRPAALVSRPGDARRLVGLRKRPQPKPGRGRRVRGRDPCRGRGSRTGPTAAP